jgi:hypothetical protein
LLPGIKKVTPSLILFLDFYAIGSAELLSLDGFCHDPMIFPQPANALEPLLFKKRQSGIVKK